MGEVRLLPSKIADEAEVESETPATLPPRPKIDPRSKPYQPFGSALDLFYDHSPEILICGPAGTGKSRAALEKIHLLMCKYPGSRALLVRKTRDSLTQSALVTFEKMVIPDDGSVKFRTSEQEYRYTNGSKVVLGGMDKASKVLSSEYDIIYVMEATELQEDDFETLTTRNRFGVIPYQQVIADCNPNSPRHWLHKRWKDGMMHYIRSFHEDNPVYFDQAKKEWTERGRNYLATLARLSGVRRKRYFEGIWAAAEGMIYEEEWNEDIHLITPFKPPLSWRRYWVVDFGFTNPLVWQAWAEDEDGRLYRFAEIYQTKLLVEDACALIKSWKRREGERAPEAVICDWDAEGRGTLERHLDISTVQADKNVLEGIENVKSYLKKQEDGRPRMMFMRDSLLEMDWDLKEEGKPVCTEEEFDGYEWDDKKKKEQPIKAYDHGMDDCRYLANFHLGETTGFWHRG